MSIFLAPEISHVLDKRYHLLAGFDFDYGIKITKRYPTPVVEQKVYLCKFGKNQANGSINISF